MRRFYLCFLAVAVMSLVVADVGRAGQGRKAVTAPQRCKATPCPNNKSPVIQPGGDTDAGKVDAGSADGGTDDAGTGAAGGTDEIIVDDQGTADGDIVVEDTQAQPGLRAGVAPQGRVTVMNRGKGTTSQIKVRGSDGQTKLIPGIRLRSASGKPLSLQQFRVSTAAGQVKTVEGIRARTSSGKTTVLPVTQLRTSDGKTVAFVSPPKGSSLLVTRWASADRQSTSAGKSPK